MLEAGPERRARDVEAVGLGCAVDAALLVRHDMELANELVRALATIDGVVILALVRHDQVTRSAPATPERHALDVSGEIASLGPVDGRTLGASARFRTVFPQPDVLLADIEPAQLVVGDTALGLRAHLHIAHGRGAYAPAPLFEPPLPHQATVRVVDKKVEAVVARTSVQADTVGIAQTRGGVLEFEGDQSSRRRLDTVQRDRLAGSVACRDQRHAFSIEREPVA